MTEKLIQGTPEWINARCGMVGASNMSDMMAGGKGLTRKRLLVRIVTERLTGIPEESFTSQAMQWGIDTEPQARAAYEFLRDAMVETTGFHKHPSIDGFGASPDGLVGDDGLIEIKCPNSTTHVATIESGKIDTGYLLQMQWQMACTGRKWCDFVSFDPRMPAGLEMYCVRLDRDNARITELEQAAIQFNNDVADMIERLHMRLA